LFVFGVELLPAECTNPKYRLIGYDGGLSYVKKMIVRNAELKDSILKASRAMSGIAPQVGAGKGSITRLFTTGDHCFLVSVLRF